MGTDTKIKIIDSLKYLLNQGKRFNDITIRDIAKQANINHATIYLYYNKKEDLLYELANAPLYSLKKDFQLILDSESSCYIKLQKLIYSYINFGLTNKDLYSIFITYKAGRVDKATDSVNTSKLSKNRIDLFNYLYLGVESLIMEMNLNLSKEVILNISRNLYYICHGVVTTYQESEENIDTLEIRIQKIIDDFLCFVFK